MEFDYGKTALIQYADDSYGIGVALFDESDKYTGAFVPVSSGYNITDLTVMLFKGFGEVYDSKRDGIRLLTEGRGYAWWKEHLPICYDIEPCPKCWGGKIRNMRGMEGGYYEPCSGCGYQKKMRSPPHEHAMACPACGTALVKGELKCYETLSEHVGDVNGERVYFRETWLCPKKKCVIHQDGGFYGYEGSYYGGKNAFRL
jgi:predicted nucleic acid-binding Zn ribbon protein